MITHADGEGGPDVANWFSVTPRHFQSLGQDSVTKNKERLTPIAVADYREHVEHTAGENGPDVANWFKTPHLNLRSIGNKVVATDENKEKSFEKPAGLEYNTNMILDLAVAENDIEKVTSLLFAKGKHASVDMCRQSDMYYNAICRYGNTDMLCLLLENGILTNVNHIFPRGDKVRSTHTLTTPSQIPSATLFQTPKHHKHPLYDIEVFGCIV